METYDYETKTERTDALAEYAKRVMELADKERAEKTEEK